MAYNTVYAIIARNLATTHILTVMGKLYGQDRRNRTFVN